MVNYLNIFLSPSPSQYLPLVQHTHKKHSHIISRSHSHIFLSFRQFQIVLFLSRVELRLSVALNVVEHGCFLAMEPLCWQC